MAIDWEKINSAFKVEAEPAKPPHLAKDRLTKKIDRICRFIQDLFSSK